MSATVNDLALRVERLGKKYKVNQPTRLNHSLRDVLATAAARQYRAVVDTVRGRRGPSAADDDFWAIRDVSFEARRGEVLGIIGHNGAGKSTLLKTLCRIVEPTEGSATIYGRVASLLEVGTGFHTELTGRENIFLSGAILGMRRAEITRKFDEIVDFAETERFLDTPVKHYSSGMYMRLAFAVAAHLDPEILIVDEVLAVGDAAFQRKCMGKMSDVSKGGRTVLFVSHQISAIAALTSRCILMNRGRIQRDGPTAEVTAMYQSALHAQVGGSSDLRAMPRFGDGTVRMTRLDVTPIAADGEARSFARTGEDVRFDIEMTAHADVPQANVAVILYDSTGYRLVDTNIGLHGDFIDFAAGQSATVSVRLHNLLLKPGVYLVGLQVYRSGIGDMDGIQFAASLTVEQDTAVAQNTEIYPGPYQVAFSHRVDRVPASAAGAARGDDTPVDGRRSAGAATAAAR